MSGHWLKIEIAVFAALALLVVVLGAVALMTRIRYRVGSRHVKVLLFGFCIRRVALANIDSISKRRGGGWAEHWWSTLRPKHRMLVIRRKRGLLKNFIVTPKNRYVFRSDIERGMRRVGAVPALQADTDADLQSREDVPSAEPPQSPAIDRDSAES